MADLASTRVFGRLTVMHEAILKANAEIAGTVTAAGFAGDGSQITALNAASLASGTVPVARLPLVTTSAAGAMTGADKTKLDGIATGATANATDAQLRDRSTHTGTQPASTITGLGTAATLNTTDSRTSTSTTLVLQAKAMNDHRTSGDHDGRYPAYYGRQGSGTSLNDLTTYGAYGLQGSHTDGPEGVSYDPLLVLRNNATGVQLFLPRTQGGIPAIRGLTGTTFTAWRQFLISGAAGNGSGLTSLNASNLASGTVPEARLPASYSTTTANVLSATAGATAGAVGTYGLFGENSVTAAAEGGTVAGSSLRWANVTGAQGGTAPSGTWRRMGRTATSGAGYNANQTTLYLRIS